MITWARDSQCVFVARGDQEGGGFSSNDREGGGGLLISRPVINPPNSC